MKSHKNHKGTQPITAVYMNNSPAATLSETGSIIFPTSEIVFVLRATYPSR